MGPGKTLIAHATIVVSQLVAQAWMTVQASWETRDHCHLQVSITDPDMMCLATNTYRIYCLCELNSPTCMDSPSTVFNSWWFQPS